MKTHNFLPKIGPFKR